MEILLSIDNYEEKACNDCLDYSESEKERIKKEVGFDHVSKVDFVNIGLGADCIVILLVVSIFFQLIRIGAEINDGIDGWIEIGRKLRRLFRRKKIVSVDVDGATALAIAHIARKEKITKLVKLQENTINLVDVSGQIPANKGLSKKPHNYYIQTYQVNDEEIYVMGIKSTGDVKVIKHFTFFMNGFIDEKDLIGK